MNSIETTERVKRSNQSSSTITSTSKNDSVTSGTEVLEDLLNALLMKLHKSPYVTLSGADISNIIYGTRRFWSSTSSTVSTNTMMSMSQEYVPRYVLTSLLSELSSNLNRQESQVVFMGHQVCCFVALYTAAQWLSFTITFICFIPGWYNAL